MSKEIKIQYEEAEQALAKIKAKTDELKLSLPTDMGSRNNLEVIDRLNELTTHLKHLLQNYQSYLTGTEAAAKEALKDIKDLDKAISVQFQIK